MTPKRVYELRAGKLARPSVASRIDTDRRVPGMAIVSLVGEHEAFSADQIETTVDEAIAEGLAVIVDLTQTDFLDSAAVTVLLRARDEAQRRNLRFALVIDDSTGWPVRQLLDVTGLVSVFPIAANRDDAIAGAA
jgi:anti-sigma B factor antagonist